MQQRLEHAVAAARHIRGVARRRGRDGLLESLLHVHFMNRGVLITPFHSMLLTCPATTRTEADRCVEVLDGFCDGLVKA